MEQQLLRLKYGIRQDQKNIDPSHQRININIELLRHFRKSIGALIFFDLTAEKSFIGMKAWLQDIYKQNI